jgi:hypothetical protein
MCALALSACGKKSEKSEAGEKSDMKEPATLPKKAAAPETKPAEVPPGPSADVKETACDQAARTFQLAEGKKVLVHCPKDCTEGSVWGTDFYTDDSTVCPALIHAGVLTTAGGHALVVYAPGMRAYRGTLRNNIQSSAYGNWERSFYGLKVNDVFLPASEPPQALDPNVIFVDCTHSPSSFDLGKVGQKTVINCPKDCKNGSVWGTDVYTNDSNLCMAAIHAGLIKQAEGGSFQITPAEGQKSYKGSERNEVTSEDYAEYEISFKLEALPPPAPATEEPPK